MFRIRDASPGIPSEIKPLPKKQSIGFFKAISKDPQAIDPSADLDRWVEREEKHCPSSRAREAARRIREVQKNKGTLLDLHCLHLHSPPPLVDCTQVGLYWLTGNHLRRIPSNIGDLPNLHVLGIEANGLHEIPPFSNYPNLKLLSISGNPIRRLPSSVMNRRFAVVSFDTLLTSAQRREFHRRRCKKWLRGFIKRFAHILACHPL